LDKTIPASIILIILITAGCFYVTINLQDQRLALYDSLKAELGAVDAVIQSPAIITIVDTLTELKTLQRQHNATIYYSDGSFYVVPDSYMGYRWTPKTSGTSPFSPLVLENR
jgi:hypothetical protein